MVVALLIEKKPGFSKKVGTLDMVGRAWGSRRRQAAAASAVAISRLEKRWDCCGSRRGSSSRSTAAAEAVAAPPVASDDNADRAHSARNCCPLGLAVSTALLPVRSSSSTTPKAYTSAFSVILPLSMYSGARYLLTGPGSAFSGVDFCDPRASKVVAEFPTRISQASGGQRRAPPAAIGSVQSLQSEEFRGDDQRDADGSMERKGLHTSGSKSWVRRMLEGRTSPWMKPTLQSS